MYYNNRIVYFKGMTFIVCEVYLNEAIFLSAQLYVDFCLF